MTLLWALCGEVSAEPLDERMETHWRLASSIEVEAARGNLPVVTEMAGRIAVLPTEGFDPLLETQLDALRFAASSLARASTIEEMAQGVATVGEACGGCHQARDEGPPVRLRAWPPENDGAGSMVAHQEAADWLWLGLVAPSEQAWKRGARSLRRAAPVEEVEVLADRAKEALPGQRARVYGDLLIACATCHSSPGMDVEPE